MKKIFLPIFLAIFFITSNVHAETVEGRGEYIIDKNLNETFATATEHAHEEAMRMAAENAAVYVESYTETNNFQVTRDKVRIIAATVMKILIDDSKIVPTADGGVKSTYYIKAEVDTSKIDIEKIMGSELQYQNINEKNKIIEEKDKEIAKWKLMYEQAVSEKQKTEIKNEFDKSQQQFLIAKYERDLDLYDLDSGIDWAKMTETTEKLQEIEPLNATAFRATIYAYRESGDLKKSVDYCNKMLNSACPADTAIEACTQLGDIYLNELNDKANAKKFINQGISLVKKNYTATMIKKLVNGTNFQISNMQPVGKTNTIRELYILKSDLENINPTFKSISKIEDLLVTEYRIYDIKYRTNW